MYNDYYLQQIDNKIAITNSYLEDLQIQLEEIQEQVSGDHFLIQEKVDKNANLLMIPITILLIFLFVVRSMK